MSDSANSNRRRSSTQPSDVSSFDERVVNDIKSKVMEDPSSDDEERQVLENKSMADVRRNSFANAMAAGSSRNSINPIMNDTQSKDTEDEDDDDDEEDDENDDGEEEEKEIPIEGIYDPKDYEHLMVSGEIKELFQYISKYTSQTIELDHKLQPFVPDYIPAVGDIDAFIKVPCPDESISTLGLKILDEPCLKQSDPTVLDLQLRALSKQTNNKATTVKNLLTARKKPKEIDAWIRNISDLHRSKPPASLHYTKNMPDLDSLMQEWPAEVEELLKKIDLPSADLDCDLSEYIDVVCGILDIPVYKSKIQSLHMLFTLYSEFKNSQHFKNLAMENQLDNSLKKQNNDSLSETL